MLSVTNRSRTGGEGKGGGGGGRRNDYTKHDGNATNFIIRFVNESPALRGD